MMPYRDFFFSQGPVLPYVYHVADVASGGFGVLGGRAFTALLGYLAAFFFALSAGELARRREPAAFGPAFLVAFALTAFSPDWAYFAAIPKTYALGALFLSLGFALALGAPGRSNGRTCAFAGAFFALAAATRATLCIAAVPVWIALLAIARRDRARRFDWLWFAVGCSVALAAVYVPVFVLAGDNFLFSQTFHAAREAAPFKQWLLLRAGFASLLAQGYPALVAAAAILAAAKSHGLMVAWSDGRKAGPSDHPTIRPSAPLYWAVVASFALLTLAHFLVPFPYADYNTPAMPLAAVALAVPLGRLVARANLRPWRVGLAVLAASVLFVAGSPWPMKWVGGEQDRFWFKADTDSALAKLRRAGRLVRELNPDGKPILTQDAYLAVEAGCPVVAGLEVGPFSVFPDLSDDEARRRRVHNVATLEEAVRACDADVAALSGYSFAIACPSTAPLPEDDREKLLAAVRDRFGEPVFEEPRFGQFGTKLELFSRKKSTP